ncbi:hypothetical protein C463_15200 [Halorubrum californiense DSM 19288]|uniref:Proteasome lid subunit RPN8/RPN11 n=1 Tax=Halorubrum californiense DSM 19288 TaxID=1227465 RepID=M0E1R0_9EURY|nr:MULTISPECIES: hypothetical protein [Halorubrum]ELZ40279.1 hypothetical protein C463_15200 [Halorubrum californiense DSM 19288]TKX68145.1 hypothetical protein EXE40_13470 [Halorubrum sp. GN11GM_10-3_MGM]
MIYVTRDLLTVLRERAANEDPEEVNVRLSATAAGEFETDLGLDPETPVVTHFTLPSVGGSVSSVFGVDLGTPAGEGGARFLSHPDGFLGVSRTDDLAGVVIVAVPPYDDDSVAAFDRSGDGVELGVVDAAPPDESVPE